MGSCRKFPSGQDLVQAHGGHYLHHGGQQQSQDSVISWSKGSGAFLRPFLRQWLLYGGLEQQKCVNLDGLGHGDQVLHGL